MRSLLTVNSLAGVTTPSILSMPTARRTSGESCRLPLPIRKPWPPIGESSSVIGPVWDERIFSRPSSSRSVPTCSVPLVASIPRLVNSKPFISPMVRNVPPEPQMTSLSSLMMSSPIWSASPSVVSSSPVVSMRCLEPCIQRGLAGVIASAYNCTTHSPFR